MVYIEGPNGGNWELGFVFFFLHRENEILTTVLLSIKKKKKKKKKKLKKSKIVDSNPNPTCEMLKEPMVED